MNFAAYWLSPLRKMRLAVRLKRPFQKYCPAMNLVDSHNAILHVEFHSCLFFLWTKPSSRQWFTLDVPKVCTHTKEQLWTTAISKLLPHGDEGEFCWLRQFIFTTGTDAMKDFSNASFAPETHQHHGKCNGRGGRDAARPGKCGPRKFDSRNYPPHCQGRRKRPSNFATYGAIGASNYAAQLNGIQIDYQASERAENHLS